MTIAAVILMAQPLDANAPSCQPRPPSSPPEATIGDAVGGLGCVAVVVGRNERAQ